MTVYRTEIIIYITVYLYEGGISEVWIARPDKHKKTLYDSITPSSMRRLQTLAEQLKRKGYRVDGKDPFTSPDYQGGFAYAIFVPTTRRRTR